MAIMTTNPPLAPEFRREAAQVTTNTPGDNNRAVSANGRVTARFVIITPAMAKAMLEKNTNNRTISQAVVGSYAMDMSKGRWYLNTGGIGFDYNEILIDGQQRLNAIVTSNKAQEFIVLEGLEPEARQTIDIGRKRSVADELKMRGVINSSVLAAAVRMRMTYEDGTVGLTREVKFTRSDIIYFAELWNEEFQPAISAARPTASSTGVSPMVLTCAYSIFYGIDPDLAEFYFEKLRTAEHLSGTTLTVYRKFQLHSNQHAKLQAHHNLWILIRGWNSLRKGEELKKIPIPENVTGRYMIKAN